MMTIRVRKQNNSQPCTLSFVVVVVVVVVVVRSFVRSFVRSLVSE